MSSENLSRASATSSTKTTSAKKIRRPLSAYTAFFKEEKDRWLAASRLSSSSCDKPDDGTNSSSSRCSSRNKTQRLMDMTKHIAAQWQALSKEERQKYHDIAAADKKRFFQERLENRQRQNDLYRTAQERIASGIQDNNNDDSSSACPAKTAAPLASAVLLPKADNAAGASLARPQESQQESQQTSLPLLLPPPELYQNPTSRANVAASTLPLGIPPPPPAARTNAIVPANGIAGLQHGGNRFLFPTATPQVPADSLAMAALKLSTGNGLLQRECSLTTPTFTREEPSPATVLQQQLVELERIQEADRQWNSLLLQTFFRWTNQDPR